MKKYKLLLSLSAIATAGIAPVIALASCGNKTQENKIIPESMLNIESGILLGLKDGASIDAYDTLAIPADVTAIAKEAFKDAFKEDANGSTIKTIIFNSKLSFIGENAFSGCDAITKLDLTKMQDIKIMGLKLGSNSFTTWKNSGGTSVLPDGITDMQKDWIKKLFGEAGLPGSWFGEVVSPDKEKVDELNTYLKEAEEVDITFSTLSELVFYLNTYEHINLEELVASNDDQYVWDCENNVIFTMNTSGQISYAPEGYTLNPNKDQIWKMVDLPSSTKLLSSRNGKTEQFDSTSPYGQYLRAGQTYETSKDDPLSFSCSIDTGSNEDLFLKYEKPEATEDYVPKIVTYCSDLEIVGSIGNVDHYGHAKSITVTALADTYNEYGTVDGNIILKEVPSFTAKPTSDINLIIVESNTVEKLVLEKDPETSETATVGTVAKTNNVIETIQNLVDDTKIPSEKQPDKPETPIVPTARYAGGIGTVKSPYAISTPDQLVNCSTDVNNATLSVSNTLNFILLNDIDMSAKSSFIPIGSSAHPFYGVFEGNLCSIKNLTINTTGLTDTYGFGLFGWTNGKVNDNFNSANTGWDYVGKTLLTNNLSESNYTTVIKNINLENININLPSKRSVGAIVGSPINTHISNCHVKSGTINGYKGVGGLIGSMSGTVCSVCSIGTDDETQTTNVIATNGHNIGGIVGTVDLLTDETETCNAIAGCWTGSNCTITSSVTDGCVGGIVSYCDSAKTLIVDHCENNAKIESNGTGTDNSSIAGIAGYGLHTDVVANCVNNGNIDVTNGAQITNASGIITRPENGLIYNCQNHGKIVAYATAGVAGYAMGCIGTCTFTDCSNNGQLQNTYDERLVYPDHD